MKPKMWPREDEAQDVAQDVAKRGQESFLGEVSSLEISR